jgi:hypothetical protein
MRRLPLLCDDNRECHHPRTSTGVATTSWCRSFSSSHAAVAAAPPFSEDSVATCQTSGTAAAAAAAVCKQALHRIRVVRKFTQHHRASADWSSSHRRSDADDRIAVGCCERDGICHSCCCAGGDISQHRQQRQDSTGLRSRCDAVPPSLGAACPPWLHPRTWKGCSSGVQHVDAGHHLSTASGAIMSDHSASQDHTRHTRKLIVARACASL